MATDAKILTYIDALENWVLDSECIVVLMSIPRMEQALLAARQYIRYMKTHRNVWESWAWNDAQIEQWYKSDGFKQASRLIDNINTKFQSANSGYRLRVKKTVRTVETQIQYWRDSDQTLRIGIQLRDKLAKELDQSGYTDTPGKTEAETLQKYLANVHLSEKIMVAVPGLSDHGHGNAYDLVVEDTKGTTMAGASASWKSTWDGPHGWTAKLKTAVEAAGEGHFKGPLQSPYEPWHYEYH